MTIINFLKLRFNHNKRIENSLYTRIGGEDALKNVISAAYRKMQKERSIAHFFKGIRIDRLERKLFVSLRYFMGGTLDDPGVDLAHAHRNLEITNEHFDAVGGCFSDALKEQGHIPDHISEIMALLESVRSQVVNS